jgi:hypothetical protein
VVLQALASGAVDGYMTMNNKQEEAARYAQSYAELSLLLLSLLLLAQKISSSTIC